MHLSALRLHGFKSFAKVTHLRFLPGLTAIVGPNGSGKSNIADAIRWALGEQSMRSLRGLRSQDVIFSGNGQRRALGFAEVGLHFDNEDGLLPLDFSEVVLSRRVYQTGESEFAINGVPCRLRDIQELLLDTGLGRGGFFVISQGEIDAVLSAKPEDRRLLIEEVARTSGYRLRKRQTLERLEAAKADRRRVMDILEELRRQAADLQVQAEQTRHYLTLRDRLQRWEQRLLVYSWRRLAAEWASEKEQGEEIREQLRQSEENLSAQGAGLRELVRQAEEAEGQVAAAREEVDQVRQALAASRHRGDLARLRLQQLLQEEQSLAARLQELARQRDEEEREWREASQALARVREEGARLAQVVASAHREHGRWEKELEEAEGALEAARAQWMARQQAALELEAALGNVDAREEALQAQGTRFLAEREELAEERRQLEASLTQAREALERIQKEQELLQEQMERVRHQLSDQEAMCREARARMVALEKEQQADAARRKALEAMEAAQEGYQGGVRAVMRERQRLGEGILGPVGQLLEVDKPWQAAIETALGGSIQYVVTRDDRAAQEAIAFLKEKRAGRVTFLPLNLLRVGPEPTGLRQALEEEGALGLAEDFVQAPAEIRVAVRYLLGRTVVVDSLPRAIAISRRVPPSVRLVTVEGEMVIPGGAVSGGAHGSHPNRELLARRSALKALRGAMESRERLLASVRNQVREAETVRDRLRRDLQESQQRSQQLDGEEAGLRRRMAELEAMVERAAQRIGRLEQDMARWQGEEAALRAERDRLQKALEEAREELRHQEEGLQTQREAVARLRRQLQEAAPRLNEAQARLAALQQEETHLAGMVRRHENAVDRLRRHQGEAEARREELLQQRVQLEQAVEEESRQTQQLETALAAAQARLAEVEEAFQRLRARVRVQEEAVAQARRTAEEWRQALHRHEGKWQRLEHQRNLLRERAEYLGLAWEDAEDLTPGASVPEAGEEEQEEMADPALLEQEVKKLRRTLDEMPPVNLAAPGQLEHVRGRIEDLERQAEDLREAEDKLRQAVAEIDAVAAQRFVEVMGQIQEALAEVFEELFPGGQCTLSLTQPDNPLEGGVDIHVQLPGKPFRPLLALSGGERALTALALLFSIMRVRPAPFYVLDEVDASLDEANLQRFTRLLRATADRSQVIAITHRRPTMEIADHLYGITMKEAGVSSLVSLDLREVG